MWSQRNIGKNVKGAQIKANFKWNLKAYLSPLRTNSKKFRRAMGSDGSTKEKMSDPALSEEGK